MMMRQKAGFTFVELLVVLLIGVIILGAVYQTLIGQSRANRHLGAMVTTQQTNRLTLEVLASELREISTRGGDLAMASPDSLRFRAFRNAGIICSFNKPENRAWVVVLGPARFAREDSIAIFADREELISSDDVWFATEISQTQSTLGCSANNNILPLHHLRQWVQVPGGVLADVHVGALIRTFAHVTYGHYQVDGQWVLGRRERDAAGDLVTHPLIGPLAPPAEQGLVFRYFDADGQEITPTTAAQRAQVAMVELVVRGSTPGAATRPAFTDSLVTRVHLRGNRRL